MFMIDIVNFLSNYSRDAIIVSLIVAVISTIIDKFLTQKQKIFIKMLTPFILGIMIYFLYNVICYGIIDFNLDLVYAGLMCGSLSGAIYMVCYRLVNGESNFDIKTLSIEVIIDDFLDKEIVSSIATEIKSVFEENLDKDSTIKKVYEILNKNKLENISESDIKFVSSLLYESYKSLNL